MRQNQRPEKRDILVIIPARYGSSRFPGKPLARLGGVEMIVRVCRRVASGGYRLLVATDDIRIAECVRGAGFDAVMTRDDHPSGTDRVWEACCLSGLTPEIVVNVQGDEPFVDPSQIDSLVDCFDSPDVRIATLVRRFPQDGEYDALSDPGLVKVVTSDDGRALYFSRSVIPYLRGAQPEEWPRLVSYRTHVGIYAYRRETLGELTAIPRSPLEVAESLEQLRWLSHGFVIRTAETDVANIGIDTPADLEAAEAVLSRMEK